MQVEVKVLLDDGEARYLTLDVDGGDTLDDIMFTASNEAGHKFVQVEEVFFNPNQEDK